MSNTKNRDSVSFDSDELSVSSSSHQLLFESGEVEDIYDLLDDFDRTRNDTAKINDEEENDIGEQGIDSYRTNELICTVMVYLYATTLICLETNLFKRVGKHILSSSTNTNND